MSDWLHNLPVGWMALLIFAATYLVAAGIYAIVMALAVGERARAFKAVSPGMLPPLGILFGLLVAFVAAQVWGDLERAQTAVNREASALRAVVLLVARFPGEPEARMRALVRRHVEAAVTQEWPAMARQRVTLTMIPGPLAEALQLALSLTPRGEGQVVAQREIVASLENALDARRQRIIISHATVNWVKWTGLILEAICMLLAIAVVHSDNRGSAAVAMAIFATGVAVSVVLIAAHNRPFSGEVSVRPDLLRQAVPEARIPASGP
jgi:Protein of unknown function (DUF4239)